MLHGYFLTISSLVKNTCFGNARAMPTIAAKLRNPIFCQGITITFQKLSAETEVEGVKILGASPLCKCDWFT